MIGARIRCDHCGFIGEMEMQKLCKTNVAAPSGWAVVYPTVRIKGERELRDEDRKILRAKIAEKCPAFHVCPRCIFGAWEVRVGRLLGAPSAQA